MRKAVLDKAKACTVVIKAAAVSDYRPNVAHRQKLKKTDSRFTLDLERTVDILEELGKKKGGRILVGFAAETENLVPHAKKKLTEKNLDLIVVNDVTKPGAGFAADTNQVKILYATGEEKDLPLISKEEVSQQILDDVVRLLKQKSRRSGIL
jgi:phosphopantothenoylcysteine decarboxylase/phosphopantothenate--cysteine ligase